MRGSGGCVWFAYGYGGRTRLELRARVKKEEEKGWGRWCVDVQSEAGGRARIVSGCGEVEVGRRRGRKGGRRLWLRRACLQYFLSPVLRLVEK